ncbi:MAG TPA: PQQ-binding-like beta-propeller repeat protein [Polyangiaceae bacterium]
MRGALAVSTLLLTACTALSGGDRVNPETPSWFSHPSGDMSLMFRRTLTIEGRKVGEEYESGSPEIDPVHARIFVGSSDRGLYALRAFDGSDLWRFETAGMVQSEPLYDPEQDVVYFGSNDGALYAVHADNGALIWRYDTGTEIGKRPALRGDTLVFENASDQVFAVDRTTGKTKWQTRRTPALGMEIAGYAGPTIDGSTVFVAFSDGHVGAYDLGSGAEKWNVDLSADAEQAHPNEVLRHMDVDTTPVVVAGDGGPLVIVASYDGGVYALDEGSGARIWTNNEARGVHALAEWHQRAHAPHPSGPDRGGPMVAARDIVFAASSSTGLWALEPTTGRKVWRIAIPEGGITAPVGVAGAVAVGTTHYGLFLISPVNGRVIDGLNLDSGFAMRPAAFGNRLYAMTNAGTLLGLGIDPPLGRR